MLTKYNNLTQRIITGVGGTAVIIFSVVYSEWTYFVLFFFICLMTLMEFYKLSGLGKKSLQKIFSILCGMVLFVLSFFIEKGDLPYRYYFFVFPFISCLYMISLYSQTGRSFIHIGYAILGIFYVAVPFSIFNTLLYAQGTYNFDMIVGCLFILWASDTGSYFAGKFFGKKKLFESISPKKSWEGTIGGAVLALCFAWGASYFFDVLTVWKWMVIAVIIIVAGTYGDLVESLLKRSFKLKDSGTSIPGHGGFLDRFDGLLISSPFIVAFLEIVNSPL